MEQLIELYYSKVSSSPSREILEQDLTWLTDNGWSSESIFFSINFAHKYYPSELEDGLKNCLDNNRTEMLKYYRIARTKKEVKVQKESDVKYDSRNTTKRTNSQSWFRKSIDFDLFK